MSGSARRVIYWDTCCFLAYIMQENRPDPADLAGVNEQADQCVKDEIDLATSVMTLVEVAETKLAKLAQNTLRQLFQRRNCRRIDVNVRIAELASEMRDYYRGQSKRDALPTLSTADAIHLATAIWFNCDAFYTFDERNIDRNGEKKRGLIPLSGNLAGRFSLSIEKPRPIQYRLPQPRDSTA